MKMYKTKNRNEIFQVLSGRANAYLIPTSEGNILIDTGVSSNYAQLRKHVASIHLISDKIDYLILTHTHFDHCQNAQRIAEEDGSKVIIGAGEAEYIAHGNTPIPEGTLPFTKFIARFGRKMDLKMVTYPPFSADHLVEEQMTLIDDDIQIDIKNTPGHSKGSISVIVDADIALVGDALFGVFRDSIFPPFADDITELIYSWAKLLNTGCQVFLPGHGSEIKRELVKRKYNKYVKKYHLEEAVLA